MSRPSGIAADLATSEVHGRAGGAGFALTRDLSVTYHRRMDEIFDALAHPLRRFILDLLREKDGRTLSEIERRLPLSRFGTMKHLARLEAAGLVATRKVGREKFHYLNPLPIRLVADRWISHYAAPLVRAMADLRSAAEERTHPMTPPRHVYEMYVRAPAEAVWAILTDDAQTPLWQHFDMASRAEWRVGGAISYLVGETTMIVGTIVAFEPPHRLVHTFSAQWSPEVAGDPPSRVTWEIVAIDAGVSKVTVTHDDFGGDTATARAVVHGWPESLSRLKTLAETGTPLRMPAPAA